MTCTLLCIGARPVPITDLVELGPSRMHRLAGSGPRKPLAGGITALTNRSSNFVGVWKPRQCYVSVMRCRLLPQYAGNIRYAAVLSDVYQLSCALVSKFKG
jgi:hypothetical protein